LLSLLQAQDRPNLEFHDTAVIPSFREINSRMVHFTTLLRHRVSDEHDLLLVRGGEFREGWGSQSAGSIRWLNVGDLLGLFLQVRERPGLIYKLAIQPNDETEAGIEIESVTSSEIIVGRHQEKGGRPPNIKFFFDVRSKSLRKSVQYYPFSVERVLQHDATPFFVAGNRKDWFVVGLGDTPRKFEILAKEAAEPFFAQVRIHGSRTPSNEFSYLDPRPGPIAFGPGGSFHLIAEDNVEWGFERVIVEGQGPKARKFPLPQSSLQEWKEARPKALGRYGGGFPDVREEIGPAQLLDDRLWFGKSFYDGEGSTGVGGLGYFDVASRKLELFTPPQILDWSASAILVEDDAVWVGLMYRGEWGNSSGGLLRWDRETQQTQRHEFPAIIHTITRHGPLYLGTSAGLATFEDGVFEEFRIDLTSTGRYEVVAKQD
jgi:hypothetical protein